MPIRFACRQCGRLLSIARRKAGASIDCPKCGRAQIVPEADTHDDGTLPECGDEPAEAEMLEATVVDEDCPERADAPLNTATVPSVQTESGRDESRSPEGPAPVEMVLVSRRAIYTQGALLAAIGVLGLVIGYFFGRGDARVESIEHEEPAAANRVLIEGKLLYRPTDKLKGDANAVAIFLPKDNKPARRIAAPGIRPEDSPAASYSSLRKIRELGGAYARADGNGDFSVALPRVGEYYVLLVSAATRRPDDAEVKPMDREDLDDYFRRAEYLIGNRKYRLTLEAFSGYAQIEHDFGRDRRS